MITNNTALWDMTLCSVIGIFLLSQETTTTFFRMKQKASPVKEGRDVTAGKEENNLKPKVVAWFSL